MGGQPSSSGQTIQHEFLQQERRVHVTHLSRKMSVLGGVCGMLVDAEFIDEIYECAFVPEKWPRVLQRLADLAEARTAWMLIAGGAKDDVAASNDLATQALRPLVAAGLPQRSERLERLASARHAGFLRELDIYPDEEFRDDPFYREHIYSRGLGWAAGTLFEMPSEERLLVSLERSYDRGPVEPAIVRQLDALRPHLARSALMAARLGIERARAASEALVTLGLPALVLDSQGRVLAVNALVEPLTSFLRWRAQDRIALLDNSANRLLTQAIASIAQAQATRSFPLRAMEAGAAMVAHVAPIRLAAHDFFSRSAAVLILTPATTPRAPAVELVQSLFDLTPAEARVARDLTTGETAEEIASKRGVSVNTIRTHVRGVLEKTGCRRQAEVVALLGGLSPARG